MRPILATLALVLAAGPLAAQQHAAHHAGGSMPEGWHGRVDRANQNIAEVQFAAMGSGFHIMTGPHVILWNAANTGRGSFRASATYTQQKAPERLEGYGLIVGGRELDGDAQDYLYFLIRHDGSYMIRHRAGAEVHTLANWTPSDAIRKAGADQAATNTIAIEALADEVRFLVNDVAVQTLQRVPMLNTDGIVGLRVGHHLDVRVSDFGVRPVPR